MPPDDAHVSQVRFPSRPPDRDTAERRLAVLTSWRAGAVATSIVAAALLPFATAWHDNYMTAIAASIIIAAVAAIGVHVARRWCFATMSLSPELLGLADLASERQRLQSQQTRRALAAGLRRTADPNQPPGRFDPCPVLVDRIAPVRGELIALAHDLEQTQTPDPASVALLRELLTSGTSPLYNLNLPASDLHASLARVRSGIACQPAA